MKVQLLHNENMPLDLASSPRIEVLTDTGFHSFAHHTQDAAAKLFLSIWSRNKKNNNNYII